MNCAQEELLGWFNDFFLLYILAFALSNFVEGIYTICMHTSICENIYDDAQERQKRYEIFRCTKPTKLHKICKIANLIETFPHKA